MHAAGAQHRLAQPAEAEDQQQDADHQLQAMDGDLGKQGAKRRDDDRSTRGQRRRGSGDAGRGPAPRSPPRTMVKASTISTVEAMNEAPTTGAAAARETMPALCPPPAVEAKRGLKPSGISLYEPRKARQGVTSQARSRRIMKNSPPLPPLGSSSIVALAAGRPLQSAGASGLKIVQRIAGPDGGWDYASFDPARRRVYVAHGER